MNIIRIDPKKRQITRIFVDRTERKFKDLIGTKGALKQFEFLLGEGHKTNVAACVAAAPEEGAATFRVMGRETFTGITLLLGYHGIKGCDVPIDVARVQRLVQWNDQ